MPLSEDIKSIFKQCLDDNCPQIAASLAYATLLGIIPLVVIIYKIYTATFIDPALQLQAQTFIYQSLTPETAEQVRQYLFDSAAKASSINFIGFLMLLGSVIILMHTIDTALNSIWKIHKPRNFVRRLLVYLALLIFGPLAIILSLFVSTYIASLPLIMEVLGKTSGGYFLSWLPFVIFWVAFTGLYKWVPDCDVKWLHAISGATFAAFFYEIAKYAFTLYVSNFQIYELLYGALAAIPLLLIWIYLTWLIVLIGAEISHFMKHSLEV